MNKTLFRKTAMLIMLSVVCAFGYTQKANPPQTFLWRISGNGLEKPSFLYGTIHLTDRKLFFFSDSLYHYLEQAEGFNIEIDADTMINASVRGWAQNNNGRLLKSLLNKSEYNQYADKLSKTLGKPADKITTRDLWIAKNRKTVAAYKKGNMQTIMDLYLYGLARKQGKTVGGIEDLNDQLEMMDDMFDKVDIAYVTSDLAPEMGGIETMKQMYINEDLNGIQLMVEAYANQRFNDIVLKKRNHKMAARMDSLARRRSSFFAVGVAHLPGDTGVISLLKKKGYTVDPVFSSKKISPEKYSYTTVARPWTRYMHDLNLYDVETPGGLQPLDLAKDKMDMEYYYDVATSKAYYTAVFNLGTDVSNKDSLFATMISRMAATGTGTLVSKKTIFKQNFEGRDVLINATGNQMVRMNVFIAGKYGFMAMLLSKKSEIDDPDSKRFLESFAMHPSTSVSPAYVVYTDQASAFSVKLPQQPVVSNQENPETATGDMKSFSATDFVSGNTYGIYVVNAKAGSYIPSDSSYFHEVKLNMLPSFKKDTAIQGLVYKGYPALQMSGTASSGNQHLQLLSVLRGNRTYLLIAQSNGTRDGLVLADSFFHSFVPTSYAESTWKYQYAPDSTFATWLPLSDIKQVYENAPVDTNAFVNDEPVPARTDEKEVKKDFMYYDKSTGTSYNVEKEVFSPYFYVPNDSTLLSERVSDFKLEGDSLTGFNFITIDGHKAADILLENPNSSIVKKIRFMLHGDTLYQVFTFTPRWLASNDDTKQFFDKFKISSLSRPSTIFGNKASKLISDLASSDSLTFKGASDYLNDAGIRKADLKAYYPLLTTPLRDYKESFYNTNNSLVNAISLVADSTTVNFVLQNYTKLNGNQRELQYSLLTLLAKMEQPYATESLVKLFSLPLAPGGDIAVFASSLYNNLQVAKALAPKILESTRDTTAAVEYAYIIKQLIDSNLVKKQDAIPYLTNFYVAAEQQKLLIQQNSEEYRYDLINVLDLFGTIGTTQTNEKLQEYSKVNNLDVSYTAVTWLLQNEQPVHAGAIQKLASSDSYRSLIYDTLNKADRATLFPLSQLNQRLFAASYLFQYASEEDYEPSGLKYLGDKVVNFRGERKKFYLFDISFGEGGDATHNLGIAGPFSLQTTQVTSANEATRIYWEEDLSGKETNKQFARYLQELEED